MRFAPGTTKAQMQAAMEAFENRSKAKNAAIAAQPPVMPSSLPTSRPNVDPAFLAKAVASGALPPPRPSTPGTMTSPSARPNVEMPRGPLGISVGVRGTPTYKEHFLTPPPQQINPSQPGMVTRPGQSGMVTRPGETPSGMVTRPPSPTPPRLGFKKGGKVAAKAAPVKKAAGGKVAAKAPVKKAMGGKVAAKPMAKPMSAMKRGGKVMAKGRKR